MKLGKKVEIEKIKSATGKEVLKDIIPTEILLTVFLNNIPLSILSCSPVNVYELAIGFLVNNGYIKNYNEINLIRKCADQLNIKNMVPAMSIKVETSCRDEATEIKNPEFIKFISSVCGNAEGLILNKALPKIKSSARITAEVILKLNQETIRLQKHKKEFGGLHCAALFDVSGNCLAIMEDLGRHNCIDKIAGYMQIFGLQSSDKVIFTTGRLTVDAIYKIYQMSIPVIVTNSSITHSAVLLAKKINLTSIGYARGGRFNIYTHPLRIIKPYNLN